MRLVLAQQDFRRIEHHATRERVRGEEHVGERSVATAHVDEREFTPAELRVEDGLEGRPLRGADLLGVERAQLVLIQHARRDILVHGNTRSVVAPSAVETWSAGGLTIMSSSSRFT